MRMSSGLMSILMLVVDLRRDEHAGERSVPPLGLIEGRDAHQAVHADFAGQQAVGVFAVDAEGCRLDARFFARLIFVHRGLKALRSAQRRYMRISISAQSCDSVPPAPG